MITCWERADLLALLCVVFSRVFATFPYGFQVRVGFLIYAFLFTFLSSNLEYSGFPEYTSEYIPYGWTKTQSVGIQFFLDRKKHFGNTIVGLC